MILNFIGIYWSSTNTDMYTYANIFCYLSRSGHSLKAFLYSSIAFIHSPDAWKQNTQYISEDVMMAIVWIVWLRRRNTGHHWKLIILEKNKILVNWDENKSMPS